MLRLQKGSTPAKYQVVFEDLRREILSGKYQPGDRLPSEADLVKRFGASRITVGRAVRELHQRNLVDRRAGSGTFVKADHSHGLSFGLIIPDLGRTEIFDGICQGMTDAPQAADHVLLWGNGGGGGGTTTAVERSTAHRQEQAWRLCQQYVNRRVAGVFFAPLERLGPGDHTNERIAATLAAARIPVVLLDRDFAPYPRRSRHDLVGIDNRRTGFFVTEHLLALGARRIAFVTYPHAAPTSAERLAGYREALFARELPVDPALVLCHGLEDPAGIRQSMETLRPDAVVCVNDLMAGVVIKHLLAMSRRVPEDVRVTGIDDAGYAGLLPVPLTTMRQPVRDIGTAAMTAMLERLAHPSMPMRDVLLECRLVVRESCGGQAAAVDAPVSSPSGIPSPVQIASLPLPRLPTPGP